MEGMTAVRRPAWAWLFFLQLFLVAGASVAATLHRLPLPQLSQHGFDKLGHLLAFGLLSFLAVGFFGAARWRPVVYTLALASALEEFSQRFLPGRTLDGWDLAANFTGIGLCAFAAVALFSRRRDAGTTSQP
jgi:VanZ family protein